MSQHGTTLSWRSYLSTAVLAAAIALSLVALRLLLPLANVLHPNSGHDFRILYAAAQLLRMHNNPYDPALLLPQIISGGLARVYLVGPQGTLSEPYVYPPIVAWSLIGLTHFSPSRALLIWRLFSALCVFGGTLGLTAAWNSTSPGRPFGHRLHQVLLATLVTCSPLAVYVYYWGNPVVVVYAAMGVWCWLLTRNQSRADSVAGVVMAVALLKPQLAAPLALLAVFCLVRGSEAAARRWRVAVAFGVTCVVLLGLTVVLVGPSVLVAWPRTILTLSSMIYTQPDMPSFIGLLRPVLVAHSPRVQSAALYGVMLLGAAAVIWLYRRLRNSWLPMALLGMVTVIWCFATPYSHANDALLMVPGGLALIWAVVSLFQDQLRAGRYAWAGAELSMLARKGIQAVVSVLALWALWRGGVLYYDHFLGPSIPQLPFVPVLLLLGLAVDQPYLELRQREREVHADASAYGEPPGGRLSLTYTGEQTPTTGADAPGRGMA